MPGKRPATTVKFDKKEEDLGTLKFGDVKYFTIDFTNTGKEDLVLEFVQGGCSCTIPEEYTRKPIPPGGKGYVKVKFDSSMADVKKGYNSSVEIMANVKDNLLLYFLTADIIE